MNPDYRSHHSTFQIDNFIITKGNWTPWGMYHQCLREIDGREVAAFELADQLRLKELDVEDFGPEADITDERTLIAYRAAKRSLAYMNREIDENARELQRMRENCDRLKEQIGEVDEKRRDELDAEHWGIKTRIMAAIDISTAGRLQPTTITHLLCLPGELRLPIIADIKRTIEEARAGREGVLLKWLTEDVPRLPARLALETESDYSSPRLESRTNESRSSSVALAGASIGG